MLILLLQYIYNFHPVIPHTVYRSNQLSSAQLASHAKKYQLQSIINLRGPFPDKQWYQAETRTAKENHILHYDIFLTSKELPSPQTLQRLVETLALAPRPLLLHCEGGADRSGLAAAIILLLDNKPLEIVEKQASFRYFALQKESVGKQFLSLYRAWLVKNGITQSTRAYFLTWLAQTTKQEIHLQ